jgi:hypothetical protein
MHARADCSIAAKLDDGTAVMHTTVIDRRQRPRGLLVNVGKEDVLVALGIRIIASGNTATRTSYVRRIPILACSQFSYSEASRR